MKKYFPSSELIINEDGSVFHLHVKPEWLADKVILVGDPGRVATAGFGLFGLATARYAGWCSRELDVTRHQSPLFAGQVQEVYSGVGR